MLEEGSPCFYILPCIDPRDLRLSAHAEVRVLEAASIYEAAKTVASGIYYYQDILISQRL
jgi:hypothetical protein